MRTTDFKLPRRSLVVVMGAALLVAAGSVAGADDPVYLMGDAPLLEAGAGPAYLGVRLTEETEHPEGGARITRVVEDSPADEAGLEEGDIVVGFDGEVVRGPVALTRRIHEREPGTRVALEVWRDGGKQKLEVELGKRSDVLVTAPDLTWQSERWQEWQDDLEERMGDLGDRLGHTYSYSFTVPESLEGVTAPFILNWSKPKLGVELVETTPELRAHLGGGDEEGVLVSKVLAGTPAERAGIAVGDLILSVDGESVASVDELRDALQDKEGATFEVEVARDGRSVSLEVTIVAPQDDRPTGPRAGLIPAPPALRATPPRPAPPGPWGPASNRGPLRP